MIVRILFSILILVIAFGLAASARSQDSSDDAQSIENAYDDWVKATNSKDIERWSSFLAPDAIFLPPGSPPLETNQEIINYYVELFRDPLFELECAQTFVQVADSRDLAWARGICQAIFTSPSGDRHSGSSKWTKVWVRLEDGTWKCRLNTWNYNEGS